MDNVEEDNVECMKSKHSIVFSGDHRKKKKKKIGLVFNKWDNDEEEFFLSDMNTINDLI